MQTAEVEGGDIRHVRFQYSIRDARRHGRRVDAAPPLVHAFNTLLEMRRAPQLRRRLHVLNYPFNTLLEMRGVYSIHGPTFGMRTFQYSIRDAHESL